MQTITEYATLADATLAARRQETETGTARWIVRLLYPDRTGDWALVDQMPIFGEFYDTDGIRHG